MAVSGRRRHAFSLRSPIWVRIGGHLTSVRGGGGAIVIISVNPAVSCGGERERERKIEQTAPAENSFDGGGTPARLP